MRRGKVDLRNNQLERHVTAPVRQCQAIACVGDVCELRYRSVYRRGVHRPTLDVFRTDDR